MKEKKRFKRDTIINLLKGWQEGKIDERVVSRTAEDIFDKLLESEPSMVQLSYPEDDDRTIFFGVVGFLVDLDFSPTTREDIPELINLLSTPPGKAREGWKKWWRYWDNVDLIRREEEKGLRKKLDRETIIDLLKRWQRDEIDERQVHKKAEYIYMSPDLWLEPNELRSVSFSEDDDRFIAIDLVAELSDLPHELITKEDIPAMLEYLSTPPGRARAGVEKWRKYCRSIDHDVRGEELKTKSYYDKFSLSLDDAPVIDLSKEKGYTKFQRLREFLMNLYRTMRRKSPGGDGGGKIRESGRNRSG